MECHGEGRDKKRKEDDQKRKLRDFDWWLWAWMLLSGFQLFVHRAATVEHHCLSGLSANPSDQIDRGITPED